MWTMLLYGRLRKRKAEEVEVGPVADGVGKQGAEVAVRVEIEIEIEA